MQTMRSSEKYHKLIGNNDKLPPDCNDMALQHALSLFKSDYLLNCIKHIEINRLYGELIYLIDGNIVCSYCFTKGICVKAIPVFDMNFPIEFVVQKRVKEQCVFKGTMVFYDTSKGKSKN